MIRIDEKQRHKMQEPREHAKGLSYLAGERYSYVADSRVQIYPSRPTHLQHSIHHTTVVTAFLRLLTPCVPYTPTSVVA